MIDMIDHFVLTVRDIGAACDFYARTLGMQVVTFGNDRKASAWSATSAPATSRFSRGP